MRFGLDCRRSETGCFALVAMKVLDDDGNDAGELEDG